MPLWKATIIANIAEFYNNFNGKLAKNWLKKHFLSQIYRAKSFAVFSSYN